MTKSIGWIKSFIMLVLLMLIAMRLTWLQTSGLPIDITAGFYRTGLYFNNASRVHCSIAPESTFPLPASLSLLSSPTPPTPTNGLLTPGLELVMAARCQIARLEVEDFARWNPWLFMASAFFASLTVRLLTSSWTAGLLASVAILSRGTLQSRAVLVSAEPFAMILTSLSWCSLALFGRTLWWPWLVVGQVFFGFACFFLPPLLVTYAVGTALGISYLWLKTSRNENSRLPLGPLSPISAPESYGAITFPPIAMFSFLLLCAALTWIVGPRINQVWPGSFDFTIPLRHFLKYHSCLESTKALWEAIGRQAQTFWPDVDQHVFFSVVLIFLIPLSKGRLGPASRIATLGLICLGIVQILSTLILDDFLAREHLWAPTANSDTLSAAVARVFEPLAIAWGAAALWRILDAVCGYQLSTSGWSIRDRAKM